MPPAAFESVRQRERSPPHPAPASRRSGRQAAARRGLRPTRHDTPPHPTPPLRRPLASQPISARGFRARVGPPHPLSRNPGVRGAGARQRPVLLRARCRCARGVGSGWGSAKSLAALVLPAPPRPGTAFPGDPETAVLGQRARSGGVPTAARHA